MMATMLLYGRLGPAKASAAEISKERERTPMDSTILDAKGLLCPLPVLKARKALKTMPDGGMLEILATDPGAAKDFAAFCQTTGHHLVESSEAAGIFRFLIRKSGA
jgi:tRNA 2-thiouridine synthesizing protein A